MEKLKRLKIIVYFLRLIHPSFGYCAICGLPWTQCKEKSVSISNTSGVFHTCEYCWKHSSLDDIKHHYKSFYIDRKRDSIKYNYPMGYSLEHLLDSVEKEYKEDIRITRFKKIKLLQNKIKKDEKMQSYIT